MMESRGVIGENTVRMAPEEALWARLRQGIEIRGKRWKSSDPGGREGEAGPMERDEGARAIATLLMIEGTLWHV